MFAEDSLYNQLGNLSATETEYWANLSSATISSCNSSYLSVSVPPHNNPHLSSTGGAWAVAAWEHAFLIAGGA
jgi:hypothetical protein